LVIDIPSRSVLQVPRIESGQICQLRAKVSAGSNSRAIHAGRKCVGSSSASSVASPPRRISRPRRNAESGNSRAASQYSKSAECLQGGRNGDGGIACAITIRCSFKLARRIGHHRNSGCGGLARLSTAYVAWHRVFWIVVLVNASKRLIMSQKIRGHLR